MPIARTANSTRRTPAVASGKSTRSNSKAASTNDGDEQAEQETAADSTEGKKKKKSKEESIFKKDPKKKMPNQNKGKKLSEEARLEAEAAEKKRQDLINQENEAQLMEIQEMEREMDEKTNRRRSKRTSQPIAQDDAMGSMQTKEQPSSVAPANTRPKAVAPKIAAPSKAVAPPKAPKVVAHPKAVASTRQKTREMLAEDQDSMRAQKETVDS